MKKRTPYTPYTPKMIQREIEQVIARRYGPAYARACRVYKGRDGRWWIEHSGIAAHY